MNSTFSKVLPGVVILAVGVGIGAGISHWRSFGAHAVDPAPQAASAAPAAAGRKVLYWYDPMSPTQKFDKPGKSPFMDMQLVPRYADEEQASAAASPQLAVSAQAQQALGLRLASVERKSINAAIDVVGTVGLNDRDVSIVQARAAGFVERVYARAPGDVIAAGAPLVDVLNPEWLGAQQEFLAVKATNDAALTQAARQRLVLLGISAAAIEKVERTGQPTALHTITAPSGGVITELMVRRGMSISPGMTLARINGLDSVWLEAALPEAQAATMQPGQAVQARFVALPGLVVNGRIAAVLPESNRETRTLRVRIELPNPVQRLKAGMFAQVSVRGAERTALVVPAEAVIRTGKRSLVYLSEQPGKFRPVEVQVREQVGEQMVVTGGLSEGQKVVASGQFLIDSEASLQGVMARAAAPAAPLAAPVAAPVASTPAASTEPEYQTRGIVVDIDADGVTLDHQAVAALKWPPMTMPFKLADKKLGAGVKKSQAVDFSFVKRGDDYVITRLAPAAPTHAKGAQR
ncbi:efflux RND transporter periplasmic adaptor subunit [Caenimonas koreensis DSM 17982]|uniref:Efflux RND transporter periplasmic adaptor subunit n=1 Tax=Caenimonas koreensis DSM 17982 TaxID=1121255 RepID=A0A844B5L7_9BURK|nr:efflux RND transporter periplasmic adaptor subunit [Caenimonas koreensis]MRD48513.1 efflux RND transporter periplasmic adaptor subunit [Caenimonas koreensis DSM 17982]